MPKDFDAWMKDLLPEEIGAWVRKGSIPEDIKLEQTHDGFVLETEWDGKNLTPLRRMINFLPKNSCLEWQDRKRGVIYVVCPHKTYTLHPSDTLRLEVVIS